MSEDLAVDMLLAAATRLPLPHCEELTRRLTEHLLLATMTHGDDLNPHAQRRRPLLDALRDVAKALGAAPNTKEYTAERQQRIENGAAALPSVSAILRGFGSWPKALAAAGLVPAAAPTAFQRRLDYHRRQVHRYSRARLRECLVACAEAYGRVPMVRDYAAWRESALARPRTGHFSTENDIPHHRTYYQHYGSWAAALADAGLDAHRPMRTETRRYSDLAPFTADDACLHAGPLAHDISLTNNSTLTTAGDAAR